MRFNYVMDGLLLSIFPVFGNGKGELILNKMQMELLFVFDIVKDNNGKDIMDLKKYYYGYDTLNGIQGRLDNLYNGDKKKSEVFHKIANESWRVMSANFGKSFQGKITSLLFEAVKLYMRSRPLEELALY
ncbi:jg2544 [Pararge aegeria aegeria]|uniref:Jg2544 protein n=2 Tax=Pararge aegeria TaxID=116150 RepID=A0A8S4R015_9NEOP|nr:jg2544 [Pararge aegeria aegeria]